MTGYPLQHRRRILQTIPDTRLQLSDTEEELPPSVPGFTITSNTRLRVSTKEHLTGKQATIHETDRRDAHYSNIGRNAHDRDDTKLHEVESPIVLRIVDPPGLALPFLQVELAAAGREARRGVAQRIAVLAVERESLADLLLKGSVF